MTSLPEWASWKAGTHFSLSGWHQAASHANVWVFSHRSHEFWRGLHSASLPRSPPTRPSPFPWLPGPPLGQLPPTQGCGPHGP